jgi:hypothetical protein
MKDAIPPVLLVTVPNRTEVPPRKLKKVAGVEEEKSEGQ